MVSNLVELMKAILRKQILVKAAAARLEADSRLGAGWVAGIEGYSRQFAVHLLGEFGNLVLVRLTAITLISGKAQRPGHDDPVCD